MFTRRFCPHCTRLFHYPTLSLRLSRLISTSNEPIPTEENNNILPSEDLDRHVSRLPDDVYRHFKGTD